MRTLTKDESADLAHFDVDYGIRPGHIMTIAGVWRTIPNPDREWWQFWRPRMVAVGEYQRFTITEIS